MNYFNSLISVFEAHVSTLQIDAVEGERVIYPNSIGDEPDGKREYLRVNLLPGQTEQDCLGRNGRDVTEGFYQVDIMTPDGSGHSRSIDAICNHFKRGTDFQKDGVRVTVFGVSMEVAFKDRNYYTQPISIRFRALTPARLSE